MKNLGKPLETLVRQIEQALLQEGFSVSANEQVFDDFGNQLAEFDILIKGNLGSTSINWLIECRDRPSQGSAPGSWIEQLVGRRDRFNFNKVTAVSTTGFAEGVEEYARREGIELRSVEQLTADSITSWLRISEVDAIVKLGALQHAQFIADSQAGQTAIESLKSIVAKTDTKQQILVRTATGDVTNVSVAWQGVINAIPQLFDGLSPNGESRPVKIQVNYTNPNDRYQIITNEGPIDIVQIVFQAELSIAYKKAPISRITQYSKDLEQEVIAQSAHFEIEAGDHILDLTFHNFGQSDKTLILLQANPTSEKDEKQSCA